MRWSGVRVCGKIHEVTKHSNDAHAGPFIARGDCSMCGLKISNVQLIIIVKLYFFHVHRCAGRHTMIGGQ